MFYETSLAEKKSQIVQNFSIILDYHNYHYPNSLCALFERVIKGLLMKGVKIQLIFINCIFTSLNA